MKRIIAVLLIVSLGFTLCACNSNKKGDETVSTDEYVLPTPVVNSDFSLPFTSSSDFNPYESRSSLNRDIIPAIYESLFTGTSDGQGKKLLASTSDVKGNRVTVKIQQDVKFSDGTKLISKHVKSSYEAAKNSGYYKAQLSKIESVKIVDNYTIVFNLSYANDMILNVLDFPITKTVKNGFVGTGKYYIKYLEDTPYLQVNTNHREYSEKWNEQIALYDMAGTSGPIYPFKSNKISVYKNDLSGEEYVNLSPQTVSVDLNNLVYVGVNTEWAGSLTSVDWVRQAVNIGIDRNAIAASSFLGQSKATVTPFKSEFYKLQNIEMIGTAGDLEKAVGILERNGYKNINSDGVRTNGSTALKVNVIVCTENPYKLTVAENFKTQLNKLGFGVTIKEYETGEEFLLALEEGNYSFYIGEAMMTPDCDLTEFFSVGGNLSYGIGEEIYEFYTAYKKGESNAQEFTESFSANVPFLPLFYRKAIVSVNPNIKGFDNDGDYSAICNWKITEA